MLRTMTTSTAMSAMMISSIRWADVYPKHEREKLAKQPMNAPLSRVPSRRIASDHGYISEFGHF